jgi:acetyltransferase-like isoleucine patch superfamily enzyme
MLANQNPPHRKLVRFLRGPLPEKLNLLENIWYRLKAAVYYRHVFGSFGRGSVIYKPTMLSNPRFMHIGDKVSIRRGARLEGVLIDPANPPELRIGNNVNIEQDVHIVFAGKIVIADNVSITARCSLLGSSHPFFDVHSPVKIGARLTGATSRIEIGEGSFLGIGAVIMMNVKIGRHVVIGSNSVVTKSVPDYSVADGKPAKVCMKYDAASDSWRNVP